MSERTVFVGGPIQEALKSGRIVRTLSYVLMNIVDAFERANFSVFSAHRAEQWGAISSTMSPEEVTSRDFSWMSASDLYVCVLPLRLDGSVWGSGGSHIELGWASGMKLPIIVVWDPRASEQYSHLLKAIRFRYGMRAATPYLARQRAGEERRGHGNRGLRAAGCGWWPQRRRGVARRATETGA